MNAEIITIGNELLYGETIDTNSAWISKRLNEYGITVTQRISIADKSKDIIDAIKQTLKKSDFAIITGGLGPTDDDITRNAISKAIDSELVFSKEAEKVVKRLFLEHNKTMPKNNLVQAYIPKDAEIIPNPIGTAPGINYKNKLFFLPGVPREMKAMMQETILPYLSKKSGGVVIKHRLIKTVGIGESSLFEILKDKISYNNVGVAYLPSTDGVNIRLTAGPLKESEAKKEIKEVEEQIVLLLKKYIYGFDDDNLLELTVKKLIELKKTVSTAESCTGGLLSSRLTSIPGSSSFFVGGFVTYSNKTKHKLLNVDNMILNKYGAVSTQVAESMALNTRLKNNTDFGIGITGIAGPTGGTKEKPVGTVYISISYDKATYTLKKIFSGSRETIRIRTVEKTLQMLYNSLS